MTKHIAVPEDLLEYMIRAIEAHTPDYEEFRDPIDRLLALMCGPGVEPVALVRYEVGQLPKFVPVINGHVTFDCSAIEALEYEPLYLAAPSAPVAKCAECGKQAGEGWALYCVECAGKVAPVQAVQEAVEKLEACDKTLRELRGKYPVQSVPDGGKE